MRHKKKIQSQTNQRQIHESQFAVRSSSFTVHGSRFTGHRGSKVLSLVIRLEPDDVHHLESWLASCRWLRSVGKNFVVQIAEASDDLVGSKVALQELLAETTSP